MPVFHQKRDAMIFGSYGITIGNLQNLESRHLQLKAAWGPVIFAHPAAHFDARFLSQLIEGVELFLGEISLESDALNRAGSVTQEQELQLAAAALVVDPPTQDDF